MTLLFGMCLLTWDSMKGYKKIYIYIYIKGHISARGENGELKCNEFCVYVWGMKYVETLN